MIKQACDIGLRKVTVHFEDLDRESLNGASAVSMDWKLPPTPKTNLHKLGIRELRIKARDKGLKRYSRFTKAQLIEFLKSKNQGATNKHFCNCKRQKMDLSLLEQILVGLGNSKRFFDDCELTIEPEPKYGGFAVVVNCPTWALFYDLSGRAGHRLRESILAIETKALESIIYRSPEKGKEYITMVDLSPFYRNWQR